MKTPKVVYVIEQASNGWLSIEAEEVNRKDKKGFYQCVYLMFIEAEDAFDAPRFQVVKAFKFEDENKTWWRNPDDAYAALNKRLRLMYLAKKLPLHPTYDDYDDIDDIYEDVEPEHF